MEYQIHRRDIHDIPIKTHVVLHVIASGDINHQALDQLLEILFDTESRNSGFRYRHYPTHLSIYIYSSREHADSGMAQWIAMLSKSGEHGEIRKDFNFSAIVNLSSTDENVFGFSEAERKVVWQQIVLAERRARQDADEYYPIDPSNSEQFGHIFTLTRITPLMPSLGYPTSLEEFSFSLEAAIQLPSSTQILVSSTQRNRGTTWYLVEARTAEGDFLGTGWINGIALLGQTYQSTLEQIQSNRQIQENLQADELNRIAGENNLTLDQLHQISVEGLSKNWPFPPIE